jgi:hypothetical protein
VGAVVSAAIIPIIHYDPPAVDYNSAYYPFYPAALPYSPQEVILTAPLPAGSFTNRTLGLQAFRDYLNSLSIASQNFYFDNLSTNEKLYQVTRYVSTQKNISSYFSLERYNDGEETRTVFKLYSTVPDFSNPTFLTPQVRPDVDGKNLYELYMTCKESQFYHENIVYNMPKVYSFGELSNYINSVTEDLKVSSDTSLSKDDSTPYQSLYTWSADAEVNEVVSLLSINLYYQSSSPDENELPVAAYLKLNFGRDSNYVKGTIYARSLLSQLIYDQFQLWPDQCARNIQPTVPTQP